MFASVASDSPPCVNSSPGRDEQSEGERSPGQPERSPMWDCRAPPEKLLGRVMSPQSPEDALPRSSRIVNWSTVSAPSMQNLKNSNKDNLQKMRELCRKGAERGAQTPPPQPAVAPSTGGCHYYIGDPPSPSQDSDAGTPPSPSHDEVITEVKDLTKDLNSAEGDDDDSDYAESAFSLPLRLPRGFLEPIREEEENAKSRGTSPTQTENANDQKPSSNWITQKLDSLEKVHNHVQRSMDEVKLKLPPPAKFAKPQDTDKLDASFSKCVLQKLDSLEQCMQNLEVKFFQSVDQMQIRVENHLAERLGQEERARKELREHFATAIESQPKAIECKIAQLQASLGTNIVSEEVAPGCVPAVTCHQRPGNTLGVAYEYATQVTQLLNAHLSTELIEQHTRIREELQEKLSVIGASIDSWETRCPDVTVTLPGEQQIQLSTSTGPLGSSRGQALGASIGSLETRNPDVSQGAEKLGPLPHRNLQTTYKTLPHSKDDKRDVQYLSIPSEWTPEERRRRAEEDIVVAMEALSCSLGFLQSPSVFPAEKNYAFAN
mmetsp:Transcript_81908/g.144970  ORF Transcript_81908/g.144970 Transcript_81908/m.144970 type:complete len:547 (+) Transcript_81908:72-1712(+)